ncbi:MAG: SulP family inorganic anion transporter, partial [Bacteroidota bacterium]
MIQNPLKTLPAEGWPGLLAHWNTDTWAGFGVWMVSLPISLSIAFSSGFHPLAGLITVIIGGLGIALLSSSVLSIKGPSVSMIPIIWMAIHHLSLYEITGIKYTLAVLVLAGVIQFLVGIFRLTHRLRILSDTVVYGVIAALSALIFIREIHRLIGAFPQGKDPISLVLELPQSIIY